MSPVDLPKYAMDQFGLRAINYSTNQLKGLTPKDLELIRDSGDRVGCSCLLLSETDALPLGETKGNKAIDGIERMQRVVKAASLMGCNAVSLSIKSKDSDDNFEQAIESMKHILQSADRAEINVLIQPAAGLTEDPERLTDLLKGIGGFRIGTMPDFQTAAGTGDPVGYLKKLTPYASVINASTLGFSLPDMDVEPALPKTPEAEPVSQTVNDPSADAAPESDDALPLSGLEALAAELEGMMLEEDPIPVHVGYDLPALVGAIAAVGFDGAVSIDYRGDDDESLGVIHTKEAIEEALTALKD